MHTELQRQIITLGLKVTKDFIKCRHLITASRINNIQTDLARGLINTALIAASDSKYCIDREVPQYRVDSNIVFDKVLIESDFWTRQLDKVDLSLSKEEVIPYKPLPAQYLDLNISWFEFDKRINNCLLSNNTNIIRELLTLKVTDLSKIPNLGRLSQLAIELTLKHYGLEMGLQTIYQVPAGLKQLNENSQTVSLHINAIGNNSILGTIIKSMLESHQRPNSYVITYCYTLSVDIEQEIKLTLKCLGDYKPEIIVQKLFA